MTEEETEEVSLSRQDNTAIQRAAEIQPWLGFTDKRTDVFTLKFLAPQKTGFSHIKSTFQNFLTFVYLYSMQLFSADPTIFSKKN